MLFCYLQMRACANGHFRAASILYRWRPTACCVTNSLNQLPVEKATEERFEDITKLLTQTHIHESDVSNSDGAMKSSCRLDVKQATDSPSLAVFSTHGSGGLLARHSSVDESVFKKPNSPVRHSTPVRRSVSHRASKKLKHLDAQGEASHRVGGQGKGRSPGVSSSKKRQAHLLKRQSVEVLSDYTPFDSRRVGKATAKNDFLSVDHPSPMLGQRARSLTLENSNRTAQMATLPAPGATLDFTLDPDLQQLQLDRDPMLSLTSDRCQLSRSPDVFLSDASPVGLSLQEIRRQHAAMETGAQWHLMLWRLVSSRLVSLLVSFSFLVL